ncbi:MAG: DPP IV N-terminal domain-containing protein [Deltaproteobacteria bacterium]|nr:DPP IV N-terminal domain-containing protein [Deltaproteobacteria bacterium]
MNAKAQLQLPGTLRTESRAGGYSLAPWLAAAALLLFSAAPLKAQDTAPPPPPSASEDPTQDIFIEGLGFSKLILKIEPMEGLAENTSYQRIEGLLEKNLCWSGLFNLIRSNTRYCKLNSSPRREDMRLVLSLEDSVMKLRLHDAGPEMLQLYEGELDLSRVTDENSVMALVNKLTEKITGQEGLLGSSMAFVLRQPGYAKVIVTTDTHGREVKLLSANRDINLLPRFSPKGFGLVYTVLGRKGSQVYYHSLSPEQDGLGQSRFITKPGSLNTGGAFSPSGDRVVITMSVNQNADLFMVNIRNSKVKQLTSRMGIETQAHWSHDGKKLAFVSDRSGTPQIYLLDLETLEDLRITFDGVYNADPKWSPDGRSILFTKRVDGVDQIHIMDEYGENVRRVTRGMYTAEQAEWSPDGRQVVFASNRTGDFKLYIVSADGSNLRRLTNTPKGFDENSPSWTYRRILR